MSERFDLVETTDLLKLFVTFLLILYCAVKIKKLTWKKYRLAVNTLTTTTLPRNQPTGLPPPPYYTTTSTNHTIKPHKLTGVRI